MADNLGFGNNPFLGQDNPYLTKNIDNTLGDMTRNYNMMTKPNTESAMVGSGSFGNSGLLQMQQKQQSDLADSMGKTAAGMRSNDYQNQQNMYQWDQGFNRNLYNDAVGQNQQNFNNYTNLLGVAGNMNNTDMTNANNAQNTALNYFNNFSNSANGMANGFAGTTNTTNMPGNPMLGALGGWQLGSQLGK